MKIDVKKACRWAERGIRVVNLKEGVQEVSAILGNELIDAGRATLCVEPVAIEQPLKPKKIEPVTPEKIEPVIEKVEKIRAGWWCIKFESVSEVVKVRGKTESEAIDNAVEKLKVAD